jgi:hypothetical protein
VSSQEKWEYTVVVLNASIETPGAREYVSKRWPKWTGLRACSPETLSPELNAYGKDGWELVKLDPVGFTGSMEVEFPGQSRQITNSYLCVFRRRVAQAEA